jgi:ferritin-like metal-binding protein YciE
MASGNIGRAEQWVSTLVGLGLLLAAGIRRGAPFGRTARAAAGLYLTVRGLSGYCLVKGSISGQASWRDGVREQWHRLRSGWSETRSLDSFGSLYVAEVQELHSAETQLRTVLETLPASLQSSALATQIEDYNTELGSRDEDLRRVLRADGANLRQHSDQAMAALLLEMRKIAHVCTASVREAALLASLQRILHFKIAGYGTVATYAAMLGRAAQASRFAEYADRDKHFDAVLSEIARSLINPRAQMRQPPGGARAGSAMSPH